LDRCPDSLIAFAVALAEAARPITRAYFRTPVEAEVKADESPVSIADKEAEARIREMIEAKHPDHGIYGEEYGKARIDAEYVWVIDPIDGTKSFLVGKPLFGTLIGLMHNGPEGSRVIAGVIDMPALDERWIGATGHPSTHNGKPIRTRKCDSLAKAWMLVTSPDMFLRDDEAPSCAGAPTAWATAYWRRASPISSARPRCRPTTTVRWCRWSRVRAAS
jgi:inositol-phosphate phosphatase/L-galactose 1-phosphate phosphatase/histidinol-phosphatase